MSHEHLIRLPFSKWSLWPCACVRGAGFPVAMLDELSSPTCARMAARLLEVRAHRDRTRSSSGGSEPAASLEALNETFAAETLRVRAALRRVAADTAFREAVVWQNRAACGRAVALLATAPLTDVDSAARRNELLVASYLQRYCAKNESIGFFGPVGWAGFGQTPDIVATSGPTLLKTRDLYFESWCIDAIAHALDRDPDLRPWRVPYLPSFVRLNDRQLLIGSRVVRQLSADECRLVHACDGTRHAQAIARDLRSAPDSPLSFESDAAIYRRLNEWERAGHLIWTFEGTRALRPERQLRDRLERIDDQALRTRATAMLDEIEAAAPGIRRAVGNADALDHTIESLETTFTRVTGRRRPGETEKCMRDGRWFTKTAAATCRWSSGPISSDRSVRRCH